MSPGGATSFVVLGCGLAALLGLAAAIAAQGRERGLWLGIAIVLMLFGANKAFAFQAIVVAQADAMAKAGGWYGARRGPQATIVALLALMEAALLWRLSTGARHMTGAIRAALGVITLLVLYAMLGMISLHWWDRLVGRPMGGVPLYNVVELVGPALIGLCALGALALAAPGGRDGVGAGRQVLVGAFLLGWMLLPVAAFPPVFGELGIPGTALPGATLVTKAALLAPALLLVSVFVSAGSWRRWRPHPPDLAMALFCAAPLLHGLTLDALYLAGAWLALWLLGRVLLAGPGGRRDALALAAFTGLALLPIALLEGVARAWLYGAVYGPHPFQTVGADRYVGFRPLGFFEDGNQYGIWTAMAALAGIELARTNRAWRWIAGILVAIALASQSAGAILLLGVGAAALLLRPTLPRWLLPAGGAMLLAGGALYLSGVVPVEHLARETRPGQMVLGAFRAIGRNSLPWRISQDQRALPLVAQHPVIGHGAPDWWRPVGRRPWGLPMLVIGQYGLIAFALLAGALLAGSLATLWRGVRDERFALAVIVILAGVDAMLNSTIYFPAVLFAGALAGMGSTGRKAWT